MTNYLTEKIPSLKTSWVPYVLIPVYYLIIMFQGFDVCDEGFALTSYQQVFNAPETVEYNMLFWLTTVLGGLFFEIFPNGGILSFRVLGAITLMLTMFFAHKTLKLYIKKQYILIAFFMVMIVRPFGIVNFSYNHLSGLLAVINVMILFRGIIKGSYKMIFISGVITAVNSFSSLPNLSLFVLLLAIPFYAYVSNNSKKYILHNMMLYFAGGLMGFAIVLTTMRLLGHLEIFEKAFSMIVDHSEEADSNHNLVMLLKKYAKNYLDVIKHGSLFFFCGICFLVVSVSRIHRIYKWISYPVLFVVLAYSFKDRFIACVYFFSITGAISHIINPKLSKDVRLLSFVALLTTLFLPLGSDAGMLNVGHASIWLSLPFFFALVLNFNEIKLRIDGLRLNRDFIFCKSHFYNLVVVVLMSYFTVKAYNVFNGAYYDPGSRLKKIAKVNNDLSKGIYTTERRAEIINEALGQLRGLIKPGDYLLAYDKLPMFYYLTQTKPYAYIPWIWSYDSYTFKRQLKRAEGEIDILPVVIHQKFETMFAFSDPIPDYLDENREDNYLNRVKSHKVFKEFLSRNGYKVVWENAYYSIYTAE